MHGDVKINVCDIPKCRTIDISHGHRQNNFPTPAIQGQLPPETVGCAAYGLT